ncbi:MAG: hypothetical protein EDR02_01850 [Actinobacteria bacterium]|nr:MAG: hypothetical protein EDR02_01850 [Actinomycetota bacterium]
MKPFLRPSGRARLAPAGWVSEPAGLWAGRQVEVVFDPNQHQIVMVRNDPGDITRAALAAEGFRRLAVDGRQEMWLRDRASAAEQTSARVVAIGSKTRAKAAGIEGPGL